MSSVWKVLGVTRTAGRDEIRRAYARRLKTTNPEDDAEAFKALREAYEIAMRHAAEAEWRREQKLQVAEEPEDLSRSTQEEASQQVRPITPEEIASGRIDPTPRATTEPPPPPADESLEPAPVVEPPAALIAGAMDLRERHASACDALGEFVRDARANPAEVRRRLNDLLTGPAMDSIDVHNRTEHWLASLIYHGGRGTDALVDPAIDYFGWAEQRVGHHNHAADAVLQRRYELDLLKQFAIKGSLHQSAFDALRRKPTGWNWARNRITMQLGVQVHRLLARIRREHPNLERYLDAEAVAWWEHFLARKRVGPATIWLSLAAGVLLAMSSGIGEAAADLPPEGRVFGFLAISALVVLAGSAISLGAVLFRLYGFQWPREQWRRSWASKAPAWARLGWAPAAVVLAIVATVAPPSPNLMLWLVGAGLVAAAWARITGDFDRRDIGVHVDRMENDTERFWMLLFRPGVHVPWQLRAALSFVPLAPLCLTLVPDAPAAQGLQMSVAIGIAALVFVLGAQSLADAWTTWPARIKGVFLAGLGLLVLTGATLTLAAGGTPGLAPFATLAIAVAVLLHKIPAFHLDGLAFAARDLLMRYGWMAWAFVLPRLVPESFGDPAVLWIKAWVVSGVIIALVGAAAQLRTPRSTVSDPSPAE